MSGGVDEQRIAASASEQGEHRTTIVGVGASAGGIKALQEFFEELPAEPGVAFVVIVHLDPKSRSELPEILAARCKMPAQQVTKTSRLKPNCIYVIPPDRQLKISDDEIAAIPFQEPRGQRAPIDLFFRSLAQQHGDAYAIILTGAGSDGAVGVKAIKESGGIVLVQDPEEAEYPSMPLASIATEAADFVLPIRPLANRLLELLRARRQTSSGLRDSSEEEILRRILSHLRVRTGHDFSHYKRSTVVRRIVRRTQVARRDTLEQYFAYLRENPDEAQLLLTDLLISVTTFFRDARSFEKLAKLVIPRLFDAKDATIPIRIWVVGCATGEEAYSIGMLMLEEAARHDLRPDIQIFATDLDTRALAIAREGRYPATIETDVSEDRLRRFFQRDGDHFRVKRELRDMVLFASHSLLKDPPFSHLDLVSCRNLLIYLNRELQEQVVSTLHYALSPTGFLFLGSSESADHTEHLFQPVDRESRLYQSRGLSDRKPPLPPGLLGVTHIGERISPEASGGARGLRAVHRDALESLAPPSAVVDNNCRVVHLSESAGRFLHISGGVLSSEITDLVREEMRQDLRAALHRAFEHDESTLSPAMLVQFNGTPHRVYIQVRPMPGRENDSHARRALVLFIEGEGGTHAALPDAVPGPPKSDTVRRLQEELELAHLHLRTKRDESEAATEELRAANEELQSINEEYRSTAEELETSKEELQSINEELQTVNSELKLKLDTVSRSNSDLQNLMAATDFATLFLDPQLVIKRFTPRTTDLFNLTANDIGRPITDFTHRLKYA
ncbi:MAG TPA: chemotaxis protein CheB, partial [Rhizomicrobium sp.]|nr:chemotaxis protein CheB [Rhizomicrobium sp.]